MRSMAALTLCALLIASCPVRMPVVAADTGAGYENNSATPVAGQDSPDELKVETRKAEAVRLRAGQLRRRSKAVARAMEALEARGLRPAFEAGVSILAVGKSEQFRKTAAQSDPTIIEGDYELTFLPFDNGNAATWEGIIYFRNPLGEAVYDALLDISNSVSVSVLREQRYQSPTGGTQLLPVGKETRRGPARLKAASYNPKSPAGAPVQSTGIAEFVDCAVGGCMVVLSVCLSTGPTWAGCFVSRCAPIIMGCARDHL